eukprot:g7516.t1
MKLIILLCALAGVSSAATCTSTMQNVTSGVKFSDDSTLDTTKVDSAEDCCTSCSSNSECVAWSYEESGFLQVHGRCYLHASRDLPTEENDKATAGVTTPPPPTPPPAPTPAPPPGSVTNWVVIAAGSSTFQNYRHQADACHSYQIAKKNGIPEENIILMMMDDVANSRQNPFPGKMFNQPTAAGTPGVDVYDGCTPDYRGKDVTAQLFLDVLQGNADAVAGKGNGKVLKSGPHDKV